MAEMVKCELCPAECELGNYEAGGCRSRINRDGVLYSLVYGRPCAVAVDPIEKKPFFHFLPGSRAFSIATAGCVLGCKFCQNWQISQADPAEVDSQDLPPAEVVRQAAATGCQSITYTYTEPTVFYEYLIDTAQIARQAGIRNTMHSCGYISDRPLRQLAPLLDAADIDLKAFTEEFYARICGGRLRPVLDSLVTLRRENVWLEITNLVVPTLNDDRTRIAEMCKWIVKELGPDVPLHFSRFYPYYKLKDLPPTPVETLHAARAVAMEAGIRYVYIGNIRTEAENTFCHRCRKLLIERAGFAVRRNDVVVGACRSCGAKVPGVWN